MSTTGLIGVLIVAAISLLSVALPFIRQYRGVVNGKAVAARKAHDELLTTYERVLSTIRDLDEDYNTGKLDQESYQMEREYWAERGVAILHQLEPDAAKAAAVENTVSRSAQRPADADSELDDAIENAILAYRQAKV